MSEKDERLPNPLQAEYDRCRFSHTIDYHGKGLNLQNLSVYYNWSEFGPWYKEGNLQPEA